MQKAQQTDATTSQTAGQETIHKSPKLHAEPEHLPIAKSRKLDDVCYDIRGETMRLAQQMEEEGHKVYHLNTGNTYPFGFSAPDEIIQDVIHNAPKSQG